MRQREDTDRQSSHLEAARGNRKPYQKPAGGSVLCGSSRKHNAEGTD